MRFDQYRRVLALPGVTPLNLVAVLARVPITASAIVLTLHVVLALDRGYAAAGTVTAAATVGMAIGAPWLGRLVDRRGLRVMLGVTIPASAMFWGLSPWLPYPALAVAAFFGGLLGLPVYSVIRQAVAALVPAEQRRTAYAVDSMSVEVSYMIGPALGSVIAIAFSTTAALLLVGGCTVVAGLALWLLNPAMRADRSGGAPQRAPLRSWFGPRLLAVLLATAATTLVLYGCDLAVVASLQLAGEASWLGVVLAAWCLASLIGGFLYGAARRGRSLFVLVALLGVTTVPVGLATHWWALAPALVVTGLLCAPALTASAEGVVGLAPERARGVATGLHASALTVGAAVGAPLAGAVIDSTSPAAAFAVAGVLGAVLALGAGALARRRRTSGLALGHTGG